MFVPICDHKDVANAAQVKEKFPLRRSFADQGKCSEVMPRQL